MLRKLRLEYPGAMYHACPVLALLPQRRRIMSRGVQREDVFLCDVDRYVLRTCLTSYFWPNWYRVLEVLGFLIGWAALAPAKDRWCIHAYSTPADSAALMSKM